MTDVRVAVVTGASRGIGLACSVALAEAGWRVAIGYRSNEAAAKEAVAALEAAGTPGLAVFLDTTDEAGVQEAFRRVTDELGPVTGLINNAGLSQDGLLLKYKMETFDRVMDTNVRGAFLCSKVAMRGMLKERWGRMVNMSSAVALRGNAGQTVYAATKTALVGLTKSLAREVGAKGITVNAVCPGYTDTDILRASVANVVGKTGRSEADALAEFSSVNPQRRIVQPAEVADAVRWLCGDGAASVTGQSVSVSGGEVM